MCGKSLKFMWKCTDVKCHFFREFVWFSTSKHGHWPLVNQSILIEIRNIFVVARNCFCKVHDQACNHLIKMPHIPKLLAFIDVNVYCCQCFYGHCLLLLIFIVNVYCCQGYAMWRWAMHASVTTATDNTITDYIVISLIGIPCLTNY